MVGLNLAWLPGPIGLRFGGAVDAASSPVASRFGYEQTSTLAAWSVDLDVVLAGDQLGIGLGLLGPSVFVGIGGHGYRHSDGSMAIIPVTYYGAGLSRSITRWLSLDIEARRRTPLEPLSSPAQVGDGWEFRGGVSLRVQRR
jgi:hypothetical protein